MTACGVLRFENYEELAIVASNGPEVKSNSFTLEGGPLHVYIIFANARYPLMTIVI